MKRKFVSLLAFIMTATCAFGLAGCETLRGLLGGNEENSSSSSSAKEMLTASVESATETMVVIKVEKAEEETMLIDVMEYLQEENALMFTTDGTGMISGINGKANPADWSYCWMLYTSDAEMSNTAWGTCEYEGQTFGSAILGAEALPVIDGGVYVWSYRGF